MRCVRVNVRRLLLTTVVMTAVICGTVLSLTGAAAPPPPVRTVRVSAGDTLWGIARQHGPAGSDLRRLTYELERLNGLEGRTLQPGMELMLPRGWNAE